MAGWRFRLAFGKGLTEAPADSGKTYRSIDERCAACSIQTRGAREPDIEGGEEGPCVPAIELDEQERQGHPCPRREWGDPDDPLTADLAWLAARPATGHLFRTLFDTACGDWPRDEQLALLNRIQRAYGDEVIALVLWPPPPSR